MDGVCHENVPKKTRPIFGLTLHVVVEVVCPRLPVSDPERLVVSGPAAEVYQRRLHVAFWGAGTEAHSWRTQKKKYYDMWFIITRTLWCGVNSA